MPFVSNKCGLLRPQSERQNAISQNVHWRLRIEYIVTLLSQFKGDMLHPGNPTHLIHVYLIYCARHLHKFSITCFIYITFFVLAIHLANKLGCHVYVNFTVNFTHVGEQLEKASSWVRLQYFQRFDFTFPEGEYESCR